MNTFDIRTATTKEVMIHVITQLMHQGRKSVDRKGECAYRGLDGLRCAAGFTIPNEAYRSTFEGTKYSVLVGRGDVPTEHHGLVAALQDIHDWHPVEQWAANFNALLRKYKVRGFMVEDNTMKTTKTADHHVRARGQ